MIVTPSQAGDAEKGSDSTGESFELKVFAAAVEKPEYEEWFSDTDAPFHLTDLLGCMRDLKPLNVSVDGVYYV